MIYLKATIVGLVAGLLLGVAGEAAIMAIKMRTAMSVPGGGIGSASAGLPDIAPWFIIGFIGTFYWMVRRGRHRSGIGAL